MLANVKTTTTIILLAIGMILLITGMTIYTNAEKWSLYPFSDPHVGHPLANPQEEGFYVAAGEMLSVWGVMWIFAVVLRWHRKSKLKNAS